MAVGNNVLRKEGYEKLTGAARYIDDIALDGMLFGKTIRSTVVRGRIKSIKFDSSYDWSTVVVADYRDIAGKNYVALIENDLSPDVVVEVLERHGEQMQYVQLAQCLGGHITGPAVVYSVEVTGNVHCFLKGYLIFLTSTRSPPMRINTAFV